MLKVLEEAKGSQDLGMEEQLRRFWDRYPMDDRATQLLLGCPAHLQKHVIDTFDPKNKQEVDYSRQVTGYIRSLQTEDMVGHKRGHEEHHREAKRSRVEVPPPSEDEIMNFCQRYPMDDRALDYLQASDPAVQRKVLSELRPKVENEPDYSSLVTSLVKKMRLEMRGVVGHSPGGSPGLPANHSTRGPTLARLREFRDQFPMDERAWDYLFSSPGYVQEVVVNEFNPRRPDDTDFSAPVTAFVKSMLITSGGMESMSLAKLESFREKYPMDDKAFDYICATGFERQSEVLQNFNPRNDLETDYSRQITAFLTLRAKTASQGGYGEEPRHDWRSHADTHEASAPRRGSVFVNAAVTSYKRLSDPRDVHPKGDGKGGSRLQAFRARYPMDDRAFDYLVQADPHVQDMFMAEFQPPRRGRDNDYSASVTSFLKVVRNKMQYSHPISSTVFPPARGLTSEMTGDDADAMLEGFRRRYPMDDKAFDYVYQQNDEIRRKVVNNFKPKFEGEADYSSLITAYVKSCRPW